MLEAIGFGFNLPEWPNVTVDRISATWHGRVGVVTSPPSTEDYVALFYNGFPATAPFMVTPVRTPPVSWSTGGSFGNVTYPQPTEDQTWGLGVGGWDPSDINSANFGVLISLQNPSAGPVTYDVSCVILVVEYHEESTPPVTTGIPTPVTTASSPTPTPTPPPTTGIPTSTTTTGIASTITEPTTASASASASASGITDTTTPTPISSSSDGAVDDITLAALLMVLASAIFYIVMVIIVAILLLRRGNKKKTASKGDEGPDEGGSEEELGLVRGGIGGSESSSGSASSSANTTTSSSSSSSGEGGIGGTGSRNRLKKGGSSANTTERDLMCSIIQRVTIENRIGKGNYGEVYLGKWDQTEVACKTFKGASSESVASEINLLSQMNHENVVRIFGIYHNTTISDGKMSETDYMVMEYLSKGDLRSFLIKEGETSQNVGIDELIEISWGIATGMKYLHENGIIHRDLAARNILLTNKDGKWIPKVSDFGMGRKLTEDSDIYDSKSDDPYPVKWSPPEVIQKSSFSKKSDVWSFGITLWEIFTYGKKPFGTMGNVKAAEQITGTGFELERPVQCPLLIYSDCIRKCCSHHAKDRPNFDSICDFLGDIKSQSNPKSVSYDAGGGSSEPPLPQIPSSMNNNNNEDEEEEEEEETKTPQEEPLYHNVTIFHQ